MSCFPYAMASGPDGALWFIEANAHSIGRITTGGTIAEFPLPHVDIFDSQPGLATGSDNALWFPELGPYPRMGRITTSGSLTEFPLPSHPVVAGFSLLGAITAGPDGALWFTEPAENRIGRFTTAGEIAEFPVPTPAAGVTSIVVGPDGALWFAESSAMKIGRITTAGAITEIATGFPTSFSGIGKLAVGADGNIWFPARISTSRLGGLYLLGRVTTGGRLSWFYFTDALELTAGPDHALWFIGSSPESIGRIKLPSEPATCVASDTTLCIDGRPGDGRYQVQVAYQTVQGGGRAGNGHALPLAPLGVSHGGAFWFFTPDNPEMLVKVLDGCATNGKRWVFYAADTNVGLTTTVTDTATGVRAIYRNADRHPALPVEDTAAFACAPTTGAATAPDLAPRPQGTVPARPAAATAAGATATVAGAAGAGSASVPCVPGALTLCLDDQPGDRRFAVTSNYSTVEGGGRAGGGEAISLGSLGLARGGLFWFFGLDNPEMLLKVINACALSNTFWVFYAATTNVGFEVTVTDTATGRQRTYRNADGTAALPLEDTSAFSCP